MILITETQSSGLVTPELAFNAVRQAFIAAVDPAAASFPVVIAHASDPQNRFTIKSAAGAELAGLKVGAYFPSNDARGLPRHASTILLIDQASGRIGALVEGSVVNCYRTAAADAVATDALARPEAEVLALFGTGHQAAYEAEAIARIRALSRVLVVGRDPSRAAAFVEKLRASGLPADTAEPEAAVRAADIVVTATTSTAPLFDADWVRPGTHVSSMGSDSQGKQELPPSLFPRARLFCDLPDQSANIGEFQHAQPGTTLTAIGAVLSGAASGRQNGDEITVFDSSGISLQDLHMARAIIDAAGGNSVAAN
ncbi:ornithine cyclodeaminase family protein [Roseibium salinum]|uniref:Ornithine cyclodeaminase family protein n=1 Tax=Roseibium salinum TaxID=1604349 RepID=A0ABT3QW71_9HYPH|nr:ornithine cyclodeaminase family protein [Roseibium sp. DSM 29163]MCX2721106.1 ornithine cyclodeaminase family protein [Roseibium sp. DSM 29163]MDN3722568.1 ornithine cyclodeaminase family protein [Roseibium salinum]